MRACIFLLSWLVRPAFAAQPTAALPWDVVGRSSEPLVVVSYERVGEYSFQSYGCVGDVCGALDGGVGKVVVRQVSLKNIGSINPAGVGVSGRAKQLMWLTEVYRAAYRDQYIMLYRKHLQLLRYAAACVRGSDAPLAVVDADVVRARSACSNYVIEMRSHARLNSTLKATTDDVTAAAQAWESISMLQLLANHEYLRFYQSRETLRLEDLPRPVVQDVCSKLAEGTTGTAMDDALLRTKLKDWAKASCDQSAPAP